MNIADVKQQLGDTPDMSPEQAQRMWDLIESQGVHDILELGFRHGVSTCYFAAALARLGRGKVTTIDLQSAEKLQPNVLELAERIGQRDRVQVYFESTSYTWRLMRFLEESPAPRFDMCYIDGAHNWFVDGFAFFLVDRLLKPGGWIVFDDLDWNYDRSASLKDTDWVKNMPDDERLEPQVRKVYELLVKTHPHYENFKTEYGWAFAQKRQDAGAVREREVIVEKVIEIQKVKVGLGEVVRRFAKRLKG